MPRHFTDEQLRRLRNEVPFRQLLASLAWPHGHRTGQLAVLCPRCGETRSDLNPRENLLRCFHCQTNFNPIDFTILARNTDFVEAVHYLLTFLDD